MDRIKNVVVSKPFALVVGVTVGVVATGLILKVRNADRVVETAMEAVMTIADTVSN